MLSLPLPQKRKKKEKKIEDIYNLTKFFLEETGQAVLPADAWFVKEPENPNCFQNSAYCLMAEKWLETG